MNLFCNYQSYHTTIHKSKRSNKPLVFVLLISMKAFVFWGFFVTSKNAKIRYIKGTLNPKSDWTTTKQNAILKFPLFMLITVLFLY